MQRFKNIEFLRVIGCIAIILLHLYSDVRLHKYFGDIELYDRFFRMTYNGQKAVDLFFMLSGFFFALKVDTTKSIWNFLKNKLIRLYPVLIWITLLTFIASLFGVMKFDLYNNILALCCLNGTSLVVDLGNTGIFWYVSTMLWIFLLFYYLLKNYDKKHVNLFIALLVFFSYSFLIHAKGGKINSNTQTFYNIFNVGMLRGFGGIGLGYFIAEWYKNNAECIKKIVLNAKQKLCLTIIEFMCIFFIINNLMLHRPSFKNHFFYIVVFLATILLFIIKQGYIAQFLEKDFWSNLSKYTYSFYMTHIIVYNILRGSFWQQCSNWIYAHPVQNIIYTLVLVFILGIFTYHFVEKPCADYFKKAKTLARVERESNPPISL